MGDCVITQACLLSGDVRGSETRTSLQLVMVSAPKGRLAPWLQFLVASFPGLQSQLTRWKVKLLRRMTSGGCMVDVGRLEAW